MCEFNFFGLVKSEFYTSLVDIEELLDTETILLRNLNKFIETQEKRLLLLKRYFILILCYLFLFIIALYCRKVNYGKKIHIEAEKDIASYLKNPINGYLLIKRLVIDWKNIKNVIKSISGPSMK